MDNFGCLSAHRVDGEADGLFGSVEIVVESGAGEEEEWGGDSAQLQFACKGGLEGILDHLDCYFGGFGEEFAVIFLGENEWHVNCFLR